MLSQTSLLYYQFALFRYGFRTDQKARNQIWNRSSVVTNDKHRDLKSEVSCSRSPCVGDTRPPPTNLQEGIMTREGYSIAVPKLHLNYVPHSVISIPLPKYINAKQAIIDNHYTFVSFV